MTSSLQLDETALALTGQAILLRVIGVSVALQHPSSL